jgi:hypothetical protein
VYDGLAGSDTTSDTQVDTPVGALVLVEMTAAWTDEVDLTLAAAGSAPIETVAPPAMSALVGSHATTFSMVFPEEVLFRMKTQA